LTRGRLQHGAPVPLGGHVVGAPWRPAPRTLGRAKPVPAAGIFDPEARIGSIYGRPATEACGAHPDWARVLRDEGYVEFRELSADQVRFAVREVAVMAHRLASEALGLGPVTLRWFALVDDDDRHEKRLGAEAFTPWLATAGVGGFVHSGRTREVWVRATASTRDAFESTVHELRHAWQAKSDPAAYRERGNRGACEDDATAYAAECLAWFDQVTGRAW